MESVIDYLSQTPLWTHPLELFLLLVFFWFYGFFFRLLDDLKEILVYLRVSETEIWKLKSSEPPLEPPLDDL